MKVQILSLSLSQSSLVWKTESEGREDETRLHVTTFSRHLAIVRYINICREDVGRRDAGFGAARAHCGNKGRKDDLKRAFNGIKNAS